MIYVEKPHETTCSDSHIINDVKKMRKQFSQRRSADWGKRDEGEMKNPNETLFKITTLTRDVITMNYDPKVPKTLLQVTCWTKLLIFMYFLSFVTIANNSKEKQILGTKLNKVVNKYCYRTFRRSRNFPLSPLSSEAVSNAGNPLKH